MKKPKNIYTLLKELSQCSSCMPSLSHLDWQPCPNVWTPAQNQGQHQPKSIVNLTLLLYIIFKQYGVPDRVWDHTSNIFRAICPRWTNCFQKVCITESRENKMSVYSFIRYSSKIVFAVNWIVLITHLTNWDPAPRRHIRDSPLTVSDAGCIIQEVSQPQVLSLGAYPQCNLSIDVSVSVQQIYYRQMKLESSSPAFQQAEKCTFSTGNKTSGF